MARSIEHESTPGVVGLVVDQDGAIFYLVFTGGLGLQELGECLETTDKTWVVVGD